MPVRLPFPVHQGWQLIGFLFLEAFYFEVFQVYGSQKRLTDGVV
jgi:hypothetical protein